MKQAGQKALVRETVWRENDKNEESVRSEEMILFWGVVPPCLLMVEGRMVDGWWRDGRMVGGRINGWMVKGGRND